MVGVVAVVVGDVVCVVVVVDVVVVVVIAFVAVVPVVEVRVVGVGLHTGTYLSACFIRPSGIFPLSTHTVPAGCTKDSGRSGHL